MLMVAMAMVLGQLTEDKPTAMVVTIAEVPNGVAVSQAMAWSLSVGR